MAEISERLINLINLAEMRVEAFGCTDLDLQRLRGIAGAFATCAQALLQTEVKGLTDSTAGIVLGSQNLVFGMGTGLKLKVARINTLVSVAGGLEGLGGFLKEAVMRALEFADKVVAMEAGVMPLSEFGASRLRRPSDAEGR